jgi:hypothetical protein
MRRLARPEAGSGSHGIGGRGLLRSTFPCAIAAHTSGPQSVLVIVSVVVVVAAIIVLVVIGHHDIGYGI